MKNNFSAMSLMPTVAQPKMCMIYNVGTTYNVYKLAGYVAHYPLDQHWKKVYTPDGPCPPFWHLRPKFSLILYLGYSESLHGYTWLGCFALDQQLFLLCLFSLKCLCRRFLFRPFYQLSLPQCLQGLLDNQCCFFSALPVCAQSYSEITLSKHAICSS